MKEFLQKIAGALAKTEKTLIIILLPIMCIIIDVYKRQLMGLVLGGELC